MVAHFLISARVTAARKAQFAALAHQQGLTESALLKRLVNSALLASEVVQSDVIEPVERVAASGKISVRLNPEDLLLLGAQARAVPTATYVSYLVRSHLRSLAPLLPEELNALKASIAEVGAIGRNINQIAHRCACWRTALILVQDRARSRTLKPTLVLAVADAWLLTTLELLGFVRLLLGGVLS